MRGWVLQTASATVVMALMCSLIHSDADRTVELDRDAALALASRLPPASPTAQWLGRCRTFRTPATLSVALGCRLFWLSFLCGGSPIEGGLWAETPPNTLTPISRGTQLVEVFRSHRGVLSDAVQALEYGKLYALVESTARNVQVIDRESLAGTGSQGPLVAELIGALSPHGASSIREPIVAGIGPWTVTLYVLEDMDRIYRVVSRIEATGAVDSTREELKLEVADDQGSRDAVK